MTLLERDRGGVESLPAFCRRPFAQRYARDREIDDFCCWAFFVEETK